MLEMSEAIINQTEDGAEILERNYSGRTLQMDFQSAKKNMVETY
jgi:hypothetical protein